MMSDTFAAMRLGAVVLAACGNSPSLHVVVEHPSGITIEKTVVSVYESENLHCEDIAFSRVGGDELDAVLVSQAESAGELEGISRTDHKVIVARGYGAMGAWLTAGCAEADVVSGTLEVAIATVATVNAATVLGVDLADPLLATIATTDASGKAVGSRRVSWTVYGPAGSQPMVPATVTQPSDGVWQPALPACTTAAGSVGVHPIPLSAIGGYAVQLRAEWATQLPALYSRLDGGGTPRALVPPNSSRAYCALRLKTGARQLMCLDSNPSPLLRVFDVVVSGSMVNLVEDAGSPRTLGPDTLALVSVASGSDRDVYMVNTKGQVIAMTADAPPGSLAGPCTGGTCAVDDVVAVPACGAMPGRLLLHTTGTGATMRLLDARGGNSVDVPAGTFADLTRLDNAGCVTRLDPGGGAPTYRQVMTFHIGITTGTDFIPSETRAIYSCNQIACMSNQLLAGAGVTFITGNEPRMVITSLDATGVVLSEVVMAPDNGLRDLFVERTRLPAAGPPDHLAAGQFDTDSMTDLFWSTSGRRTAFEVAYARMIGNTPLEAISASQAIDVDAIVTGDLTGEGLDDIVITGRFKLATTFTGVAVIPMNLAAAPVSIATDPTCQP